MKRIIKSGALLLFFIILCSCRASINNHYLNVRSQYLADNSIPDLKATHHVAIKNISTGIKEKKFCQIHPGDYYWGKLYDFTESTVSIVKDALQRKNIIVDDTAEKTLELYVKDAWCDVSFNWSATTTLIVRTGTGLEKYYKDSRTFVFREGIGPAYEVTLAECVEQMLNDKEIIAYLEN